MSLGDVPPSESKPRIPATRDGLIIAVVFASIIVVTVVMVLFRMLPGTSSANSRPSSNGAPGLAQSPNHPSNAPATPHAANLNPQSSPSEQPPTSVGPAVRVVENSVAVLLARATSQMVELQQIGEDASTALTEIENSISEWEQQTTDILNSTAGRELATQPKLVEQFAFLTRQPNEILKEYQRQSHSVPGRDPRPTLKAVKNWRKRLDAFMKLVELPKNGASEITLLSQDFKADLQNLLKDITDSKNLLMKDLATLNHLSAEVRDAEPGTKTLADALMELNKQQRRRIIEVEFRGSQAGVLEAERKIEDTARFLQAAEIEDGRAVSGKAWKIRIPKR